MSKSTLVLLSSLIAVATPHPTRACGFSEEQMKTMRENHALAVAMKCENAIVRPGSAIGSIFLGQSAEDAARAPSEGISFEITAGRVARIRRAAANACVSSGYFAPLRVISATSDVAPLAACTKAPDGTSARCDGLTVVRERGAVRVEVTARTS